MNNDSAPNCLKPGLILPLVDESQWTPGARAVLYFVALVYSFVGVAIVADVFMCSIERITSSKRRVKLNVTVDDETGSIVEHCQQTLIWNPTVANLTLMALGSSAPEILLSIIEIVGNGFKSGDLGPGTIVGSAAFNLFIITAICIVSVGQGTKKRIEDFNVFCLTSSWSIFAYLWLIIILVAISPGVVEVWEGILTLVLFAALIISAYVVSVKMCLGNKVNGKRSTQKGVSDQISMEKKRQSWLPESSDQHALLPEDMTMIHRLVRELRHRYPHLSDNRITDMVVDKMEETKPHDRLWYRIMTIRRLSSSLPKTSAASAISDEAAQQMDTLSRTGALRRSLADNTTVRAITNVEFAATVYAVNPVLDKKVYVNVVRRGSARKQLVFTVRTINGTAKRNVHYLNKVETAVMQPNEREKRICIDICNDAEWQPSMGFWVKLSLDTTCPDDKISLGLASSTSIIYPSPADENVVEFAKSQIQVKESEGFVRIPVTRRGPNVITRLNDKSILTLSNTIEWITENGTAKRGEDYLGEGGSITMEPGVIESYIDIPIINDYEPERDETFNVKLINCSTGIIGPNRNIIVTILNDDEINKYYAKLEDRVKKSLSRMKLDASSWKEQLLKAVSVNDGDLAEATVTDCLAHILAFPWKVLAALVPPVPILGGWLTFCISLTIIGLLTALIGDFASTFGCLVGLKDSVTAVTFVALGTSMPDTFASRLAAIQDKSADNAIGNVMGSNSVNVFLGLGVPWTLASIYWATQNAPFHVHCPTLLLSVTMYIILSLLAIALLLLRRYLTSLGGAELGGSMLSRWTSAILLISFWFIYIILFSLQAYWRL